MNPNRVDEKRVNSPQVDWDDAETFTSEPQDPASEADDSIDSFAEDADEDSDAEPTGEADGMK